MKIIEMERRTLDGEPVHEEAPITDLWCVIETQEEYMVYKDFLKHLGEYTDPREALWNRMVIHAGQSQGLCQGDDDVYGYIGPDEVAPLPTEPYLDGDGDEWRVIK